MSGRKVLVLDDEATIVKVVTRLLEASGYQVWSAGTVEEAARALREHGPVDCTLLDFSLEGVSCEEAYRTLREVQPQLKVVLSSGFTEREVRAAFPQSAHCAAFLKKPFGLDALLKVVETACAASSGEAA